LKTFQFILVKKFRVADGQVGVGQRRFPLPLDFLVQRPAPVQQEALVDKVDWNCDDERQEKEKEEKSEEKIWRQRVPLDAVNLGDGGKVEQPIVTEEEDLIGNAPVKINHH